MIRQNLSFFLRLIFKMSCFIDVHLSCSIKKKTQMTVEILKIVRLLRQSLVIYV